MATEKTSGAAPQRIRRGAIGKRDKLSVKNQDPNYVYRVVNANDDRVQTFIDQGYEIVSDARVGDKRVDNAASLGASISVGNGVKAVIMRQRRDWYQEDQALKQAEIDNLEAGMNEAAKRGT